MIADHPVAVPSNRSCDFSKDFLAFYLQLTHEHKAPD